MDNLFGITPEPGTPPALEGEGESRETREGPGPDGTHTPDQGGSTPPPATKDEPAEVPATDPEPAKPSDDDDPEAKAFEAAEGEDGIRLGNKVYKDWAAADHVFRTFAGKASAESRRRRELEQRLEAIERERDELRSRPAPSASAEREVPPASTPEPRVEPRKRLKEVLTRDEVNRMIVDDGIDAVIERLSDLVDERIEQTADEKFAPLKPLADRKVGTEMAVQAFDAAANRTTKDGSFVFPELDPEKPSSDAIVQIWQRRVFEDEDFRSRAFEPLAIEACVLEYRAGASTSTAPEAAPRPSERPAAAELQGMGRQPSPSPAAPGPTRRIYADPEETTRRIFAARSDNPFGVEQETPRR